MQLIDNNLKQDKNIILWINSAKGIGVILIILGHLLYSSNVTFLNQIIYSFHMPLFFILAGYVQKENVGKEFIVKRIKRLVVPYLAFSVVGLHYFALPIIEKGGTIHDVFFKTFYVNGFVSNSPLWFLIVMFEISVMISLTKLPQRSLFVQLLSFFVLIIFGGIMYKYLHSEVFNCFGFNRMIICFGFYVFGMIIRQMSIEPPLIPSIIVLTCINVVFGLFLNYEQISIFNYTFGRYLYFVLAAISGSLAIMAFCKRFLINGVSLKNYQNMQYCFWAFK